MYSKYLCSNYCLTASDDFVRCSIDLAATRRAVKLLTDADGLSVQEEKCVCITNTKATESLLMKQEGLSKVSRSGTRNLGIDAFSGRRGSAKVRKGRILKA